MTLKVNAKTTTSVPSDVQKLAVDAAAEMTLEITAGKVW